MSGCKQAGLSRRSVVTSALSSAAAYCWEVYGGKVNAQVSAAPVGQTLPRRLRLIETPLTQQARAGYLAKLTRGGDVLFCSGDDRILWSDQGAMNLKPVLGTHSIPTDINAEGIIVGYIDAVGGQILGFTWSRQAGLTKLPAIREAPIPPSDPVKVFVNDRDEVFAYSTRQRREAIGYWWSQAKGSTSFRMQGNIVIHCVNSRRQIGGQLDGHAFYWSESAGTNLIRPLRDNLGAYVWALNDSGRILGAKKVDGYQDSPFIYDIPTLMFDTVGRHQAFGGMNQRGIFVGGGWFDRKFHAFVAANVHAFIDLNDAIDPASGWELTFGANINDKNQILCAGTKNSSTNRMVLLTPEE